MSNEESEHFFFTGFVLGNFVLVRGNHFIDGFFNRTHVGDFTYDDNLPNAVVTAGKLDYAYDDAGMMTRRGSTDLFWDDQGHLIEAKGADGSVTEIAYSATPLRPLLSLMVDGLTPLVDTYPTSRPPLLLMNSPQDHVVDPAQAEFLATTYGGPVERVTLERSYHVATQDYDRALIEERAVAFARRVTS